MLLALLSLIIKFLVLVIVLLLLLILVQQIIYLKLRYQSKQIYKGIRIVSFVHPFCSDCGGGEKVLWRMITSLINYYDDNKNFEEENNQQQKNLKKMKINIISGQKDNIEELLKKLKERFSIILEDKDKNNFNNKKLVVNIELISLNSGFLLKPKNFFTMLLQILGQMYFSFEIVSKVYSDVYCDTTGLPFTYSIFRLLGHAKVTAYTHYPFISHEMIYQVQNNIGGVHSRGTITKIPLIKEIKLFYYKLILKLYSFLGNKFLSYAYVNSTWTYNHIKSMWTNLFDEKKISILYPPCSTKLYKNASKNNNRRNLIVSFAQFRPEKEQDKQVRILQKLKRRFQGNEDFNDLELHIIGGVRNPSDQQLFDDLNKYIKQLGMENYVKLIPNASVKQILDEFSQAKIGIHTMINEHFGITLIEMMAAGLILVTHNSAGAKDDIIKSEDGNKPGYLVNNEDEYVQQIEEILLRYNEVAGMILSSSTRRAEMFSDDSFKNQFNNKINEFL